MPNQRTITFVVATYGNDDVLRHNFLASTCLRGTHGHQVLIQRDYSSAAKAFNEAIGNATNDLLVFVHQDIILPDLWLAQLERALAYLERTNPAWGVLGCYGVGHDGVGHGWGYAPRSGPIGKPFDHPVAVQTLDEIVLIFRKSSGFRFDDDLPHFHLYGTDICLRAAQMAYKCYAIPAFCIHNANYSPILPKEFYSNYRYIRRVWSSMLPIYTSCQTITNMEFPFYKRRLQEAYLTYVKRMAGVAPRVTDVTSLISDAASLGQGL